MQLTPDPAGTKPGSIPAKRRLAWLVIPLLAGCGASLSSSTTALTRSPADEVFSCAMDYLKAEGYFKRSVDEGDLRLVYRKEREGFRTAEPSFRRAFDELTVEIDREASDGSSLEIIARTWYEYSGRRGPTLVAKRASAGVEAAAHALSRQCAPTDESGRP